MEAVAYECRNGYYVLPDKHIASFTTDELAEAIVHEATIRTTRINGDKVWDIIKQAAAERLRSLDKIKIMLTPRPLPKDLHVTFLGCDFAKPENNSVKEEN